ncbi:glycosyltransferase [Actinomadura madurae]|uniref:glycosyltransferase n=2 Tax=Actinomadura madurae TaxID=1993 RepID=UPI0020D22314|nr:glycosyltransferase [Actinomadura madurae]MCQ0003425.1 glycosyltransferase [Actinomadura madurae]MCQ0021225.1 glycosyltransferase [Actinomadura madurae]
MFASSAHGGLFHAMTPIIAELARRGSAELWVGCTDDREAAVKEMGEEFGFASFGPARPELLPASWTDEQIDRLNSGSRLRGFIEMIDQGPSLKNVKELNAHSLDAIDRVRPALMVIDSSTIWALDAAMTRGVPYIVNSPMSVGYLYGDRLPAWSYPRPFSALPRTMTFRQKLANLGFGIAQTGYFLRPRVLRENFRTVVERKRIGMANPAGLLWRYADNARLVIGHSLFGIEHPFPKAPGNLCMLGPLMPRERLAGPSGESLAAWLDQHDTIVYIGLGTTGRPPRDQVAQIVDGVRRLGPGVHALWSLSDALRDRLPDDLPANLRLESWVPQTAVLAHPHVRVFVSHGSNGGHHGLYHGKPLLCLPNTWEVRDGAMRFVESGTALVVDDPRRPSGAEIAAKVRRLLDEPRFRRRAGEWAARFRDAGGTRTAADLIEEHHAAVTGGH